MLSVHLLLSKRERPDIINAVNSNVWSQGIIINLLDESSDVLSNKAHRSKKARGFKAFETDY